MCIYIYIHHIVYHIILYYIIYIYIILYHIILYYIIFYYIISYYICILFIFYIFMYLYIYIRCVDNLYTPICMEGPSLVGCFRYHRDLPWDFQLGDMRFNHRSFPHQQENKQTWKPPLSNYRLTTIIRPTISSFLLPFTNIIHLSIW